MNYRVKLARPALLFTFLFLSGCSLSPAIPVLGAAFPGWFFCLLGGVLLLIPCHILIVRKGWQSRFSPLVFSYLALMFLFATILWFLFFVY
ncbi:YtcA family lipoprotein [Klebsiella sp. I138]|uniref:YtcA family lipoprotein n=1 Tax=Klebsiella sp. I138 TaxID=2755385 RepID=UPI003DA91F28